MAPTRYSQGNVAVTTHILEGIAAKEQQYLQSIQQNHTYCKSLASNLLRFQQNLPNMARGCMTQEEIDTFIKEQTEVVKNLAAKNVERERHVKTFVAAVNRVKQQIEDNANNEDDSSDFDFQKAINAEMNKIEETASDSQLEIFQEKLFLEILEKLGEHQGAVDDDVAIVQTGATQSVNLKCPITGSFMEDAMRNKLCGHSYSKTGIMAHIQTMRHNRNHCECPVPGCANKNVQESQLEVDLDTQHAVRREQRRQDHVAQQRAKGADNLIDSDED
jgi:E3 SUMO-protein ligase NSE2